jgi:hypothetical protein
MLINNEIKVVFKPCRKLLAELGGYAEKEDLGSDWRCTGPENDRTDDKQKDSSFNKNLTPPVLTTVNNTFAILSISNDPTTNTNVLTLAPSPIALSTDDKTIIPPDPREHCRQLKIAQHQHIKQTLQRLRKSDDLFLNNSITHAKDERTIIAKGNTNNAKYVAIDSAHPQHNKLTIGIAQHGHKMAYCLGTAFNWTIKKLNKNKHKSVAKQNEVHQYDATVTTCIMLTYDSGANGHYISKQDQSKAGLSILQPSTQWVGVTNGGTSKAKCVTQLPFCKLPNQGMQMDAFQDFLTDDLGLLRPDPWGT